jgi:hypothetical protein
MSDTLIAFEHVEVLRRDEMGFRCRVAGRVFWVGSLQSQEGTTVHLLGDRLVLRRSDAVELGLIEWKSAS